MSEVTLNFKEANITSFNMKPGSNDKGYNLTNKLVLSSVFTPELAHQLSCHDNFFDEGDQWNGVTVTTAGLTAIIDDVEVNLYEPASVKNTNALLSLSACRMSAFSVYDEDGSPRIQFTVSTTVGGSKIANFLDKRKFYHGDVRITLNQMKLDFNAEPEVAPEVESQMTLQGVEDNGEEPKKVKKESKPKKAAAKKETPKKESKKATPKKRP